LRVLKPDLKPISITADSAQRGVRANGVATGASCGVDSLTSIISHLGAAGGPLTLTHLALFDVGAYGHTGRSQLVGRGVDRLESLCSRLGLAPLAVTTNLDDFFDALGPVDYNVYASCHALRHAAAAHFLSGALSDYLYSSGLSWAQTRVGASSDTSTLEPVFLPLIGTSTLRVHSTGSPLERTRKTELIAENPIAQETLDVCFASARTRARIGGRNCGVCMKCVRTIVTLDALGKLELFAGVFDLTEYRKRRGRLLAKRYAAAFFRKDVYTLDAFRFARARGLSVPTLAGAIGRHGLGVVLRKIRRGGRRFLRGLQHPASWPRAFRWRWLRHRHRETVGLDSDEAGIIRAEGGDLGSGPSGTRGRVPKASASGARPG
jgi:hypothetical protein